ncbi:hypothetical protein N9O61_01805 [Octadecabacter sp.]|nr:hypothetical protein [Octadecabacter sp.]
MRFLILSIFVAFPALADTPLSGDAFEALVEGKTLTFSTGDTPYGVEYYAPDRRVIWSFVGQDCVNGKWYEGTSASGPTICFAYENNETPQCWQVFDLDGKIRADYMNAPGTTVLYEAIEAEPLICGGVGT